MSLGHLQRHLNLKSTSAKCFQLAITKSTFASRLWYAVACLVPVSVHVYCHLTYLLLFVCVHGCLCLRVFACLLTYRPRQERSPQSFAQALVVDISSF